jgi:hypothetical protein
MTIREIPRHRWSTFVEDFSRDHKGCLCTLEVDSSVAGVETEALRWPFQGLAFETGHGAPRVQIFVGNERERHLGHGIDEPRHIRLEETKDGAHTGLSIDADEGAVHLRFCSPQPPEYVESYLP